MRYFKKIIAIWLLVSIKSICFGQGLVYEAPKMPDRHDFDFEIKPSANMQQILDSVLPGVKFVLFGYTESHYTKLGLISEGDTSKLNYSQLQRNLGLKKDSIFHFSDEAVIKTFIYFDQILMQSTDYHGSDIDPEDILVSPCHIKYSGSKDQMEKGEPQRLNYKVDVKLKPDNRYHISRSKWQFQPVSIQYLIQLDDKFVTYFKRISTDSLGNVDSSGLIKFSAPYNLRYQKGLYKEIRNNSSNNQSQ